MEIIVLGSANMDLMCYVERLPRPGETLHGHKFATGFGGKGANQCVAAARLGARTAMIAKLGDDTYGNEFAAQFRKEGINVDFVEQLENESTGIAQICVADSGENHIVIVVGANNRLHEDDVTKAKAFFDTAKILICQLETPVSATLAALRTFNGISIMNAAPALAKTPTELLNAATIFCVNETEAALTVGSGEISNLVEAKAASVSLLEKGANIAVITLGALGVVYACRETPTKCIHVPSKRVEKVVDTTGAGDAFIGALAFFMARFPDSPLHQQIGAACEVAAYSVQMEGTQKSFPKNSQIDTDLTKKQYEWKEI